MSTVRQIMSPKLIKMSPTDSVQKAWDLMVEKGIHSIIVPPKSGYFGWRIFEYKGLKRVLSLIGDPNNAKIGDYAPMPEYSADPDWTCETCRDYMVRIGEDHLFVVDNNSAIIGLVSWSDIDKNCRKY